MADRTVAPGRMYVEVEYDYAYKSKDRLITVKQGESYLLVKKTKKTGGRVRKDEASKAFYVPAQYVREVRRASCPSQIPQCRRPRGDRTYSTIWPGDSAARWQQKGARVPLPPGGALLPPRDDRGSPSSPIALVPPKQMNTSLAHSPRSRAESPSGKQLEIKSQRRAVEDWKRCSSWRVCQRGGRLAWIRTEMIQNPGMISAAVSTDNLQVRITCIPTH